jgi:transcriptional regulator with XRE-family HTH domain
MEVALGAGISQRHLSFLEAGRANPSRQMVLRLAEVLDTPLRERNRWLLAAGYAPVYGERAITDPDMAQVRKAVTWILNGQEPYPALALDPAWNVIEGNRSFEKLWAVAAAAGGPGGDKRNLLRWFFHPQGLRPHIVNWDVVAPRIWQRAIQEWEHSGNEELGRLLKEVQLDRTHWPTEREQLPVLPVTLALGEARLSLFSVISTLGTAQDVTADEIRIESLFPADAVSDHLLKQLAGSD